VADRLSDRRQSRWFASPRVLAAGLVAILLLLAAAAAFLVVPGLRLTWVTDLPSASAPAGALGTRMALGARVPVAQVSEYQPAGLGEPDEAYVIGEGAIVSLVYAAGPELPELDGSGIGMLVQAIEGALDREQVNKLVVEVGATVTPVRVAGRNGYWISGPPHLLRYFGPGGEQRAEATRLVGDVLVWERSGVLYRIESGLGPEETIRIAETIAP
jgi:hypothetical protein